MNLDSQQLADLLTMKKSALKTVVKRYRTLLTQGVHYYYKKAKTNGGIQLKKFWTVEGVEFLRNNRIRDFSFEAKLGRTIKEILKDIAEVKTQFRIGKYLVDYFIPKANLAIEYFELSHFSSKNAEIYDANRRKEIEKKHNYMEIVIGEELIGINKILKFLI